MGCGSSKTDVFPLKNTTLDDNRAEPEEKNKAGVKVGKSGQENTESAPIHHPNSPIDNTVTDKMERVADEEKEMSPNDAETEGQGDPNPKLTEAEKHEKIMERIHTEVPRLMSLQNAEEIGVKENLDQINYIKSKIAVNRDRNKRRLYYEELTKLNIVDLVLKIWKVLFDTNFTEKGMKIHRDIMRSSQLILWNGTDISEEICHEVISKQAHTFFLQCLQSEKLSSADFSNPFISGVIRGVFGVFHNILQVTDEARTALRERNAVEIISNYKDKGNTMFQCKALICLSYLIDEEENEKLISDDKTFKFLVHILEDAMEKPDHRSKKYGYSLDEIAKAINLLAANDLNKEKLTSRGLVDKYGYILCGEFSIVEKFHAANGLWMLSFNKDCREVIINNEICMRGLREVKHENDVDLMKAINGTLWVLDGKDKEESRLTIESKKGHIMLSYNWSNQAILLKVRDVLQKAGYSVWMDVDQMSGNILQAMAEAIEKASIVLVCFSHKYYESPNCRLEAEYAYQKKKPLIPLKMEYGYNPEGWLGILIGTSLYFDLARESKYKISIDGLLKEIQRKDSGGQDVFAVKSMSISSAPGGPGGDTHQHGAIISESVSKCMQWSAQQVQAWIAEIGLIKYTSIFLGFDGSLLLELQFMLREAPESYYKTVREEMRFSLLEILKFTKEIKRL